MFVRKWCLHALGVAVLLGSGSWQPVVATAQEADHLDSAAFVPASGLAMVSVRPQRWIGYPDFTSLNQRLSPHEVVAAWGQEHLGIHPLAIAEVKVVIGMPIGSGPPPFGIVITTLEDFDPAKLSGKVLGGLSPVQVQQRTLYPLAIQDTPVQLYLDSVGPRTVLVADRLMLQAMRDAPSGSGPLADLLRANPAGDVDVNVFVALQPLRPFLAQVPHHLPPNTPGELRELAAAGGLLNAIRLLAHQSDGNLQFRVDAIADDAAGAAELMRLTNQALVFGKQQFLQGMEGELAEMEPGAVTDAWHAYYQRFVDELMALVQPQQDDDRVVITGDLSPTAATVGFSVGLMLPAVQAARAAARRMQSSNNSKQIQLAMHNYADTFRHFPAAAISADDGTPLLSWRVALLPYLEQAALYQEFKLDEPWNSEHNIQLLSRMPAVYADPQIASSPEHGFTTYHIPIGERWILRPTGNTRFADITDGTSNTIMLLAGNESSLVPWTSPDYLPIEGANDIWEYFLTGHAGVEGLLMGLADGSVRMIPVFNLTDELVEALLTRAGGEVVTIPDR